MSEHTPAWRRRSGIVAVSVLGGILLVLITAAVWIGVRGLTAYGHLSDAQATASGATEMLADPSRAAGLLADVAADTQAARKLVSDPIWHLGEGMPWIGPQLAAVADAAAIVDDVVTGALPPLAEVAREFSLDAIRPQDGRFDLAAFQMLQQPTQAGVTGLTDAASALAAIDLAPLLGPVREGIAEVLEVVTSAQTGADALARTTALLPAMLGAEGPRDYLVVFQNNAEWRSLGGIVGAMALIHTDDGAITMTAQGSSSDFTRYDEPVLPMTDAQVRLFGEQPGLYVQNVTQIPDFTIGAPFAREMWARETGHFPHGVVSIDPVALSYLLEATGPILLPTGDELRSDNAVRLLLNEVYFRYEDPREQDAFFAAAAAEVFRALSSGEADPVTMIDALARAGAENRLLLWSSIADEQAVLDGTTLQGRLPSSDAETTTFGVYANDGTGSKMDYYMTLDTALGWCLSPDTGVAEAVLSVTLRNTAPADAASALPRYITGGGAFGVPEGLVDTVMYVYLPMGATLAGADAHGSGYSAGFGGGQDQDRHVVAWSTRLAPGEDRTLTVRAATPHTPALTAQVVPTIHPPVTQIVANPCEIAE